MINLEDQRIDNQIDQEFWGETGEKKEDTKKNNGVG